VGVAGGGRGARDFGFSELVGVDVEDVGVVEVGVALGFSGVVVAAEDDDGGAGEGGGMAAPGTGTDALDDGVGPLPASDLQFLLLVLWVRWKLPEDSAETLEWLDWECWERDCSE
jgi:hypothetical protein